MSSWNFNRIFRVDLTSSLSRLEAFVNKITFAQSIDSLIEGNFLRSNVLSFWTNIISCFCNSSFNVGTCLAIMVCSSLASGKGIYRCKHLLLSASPISRVLLDVKKTYTHINVVENTFIADNSVDKGRFKNIWLIP